MRQIFSPVPCVRRVGLGAVLVLWFMTPRENQPLTEQPLLVAFTEFITFSLL